MIRQAHYFVKKGLYKKIQNIYSIFILYPLKKPLYSEIYIKHAQSLYMLTFPFEKIVYLLPLMALMIKL
jgi:hypothetical protein